MVRYKIVIEYDGSEYVGWQKQPTGMSIQEAIEVALYKLTKQEIALHAAGRTDAGVHALGQVAHFELLQPMGLEKFVPGLNHFLRPHKISILSCEVAADDFHARFSAKKRYYKYIILNREALSPLFYERAWHVRKPLNTEKMREAAEYLVGTHDFSSFRATECQAKSPVKTMDKVNIEKDGEFIVLYFSAKSFLHHMVRNMVGTLKAVGAGGLCPDDIKRIIDVKDRRAAGVTAPPDGLYFLKVDY